MFRWFACTVVRHKWLVAVFWIALVLVSVPFALDAEDPLEVGGFSSDETEASRTIRAVQDRLG
ncbi:MAG TPA: hypothetical protein VGR22_04080, partial [Thermomicrobiales bacterium]|nr:hypothetical protein [Thermomicrobiales bacterium]